MYRSVYFGEAPDSTSSRSTFVVVVCGSVPTFTVHPGVACPPSPLMIVNKHNDYDDDDDDDDDEDDDDEEPSVPLEQYRAWLGESACDGLLSLTP